MALFKTRPDVRLLLARPLAAGEIGEYTVELLCSKPVPIRAVYLTLTGEVQWVHGGSHGSQYDRSRFLKHRVELLDRHTELDVGPHRLRTKVRLPPSLPPSWEGTCLRVRYRANIRVVIPWWFDIDVDFSFPVGPAPSSAEDQPSGPKVYATDPQGPTGKSPYLELSLGSQELYAEDRLRATAALGNVDHNDYRELRLALIAQEAIPAPLGGPLHQDHLVARWTVDLPERVGELQPIPFQLSLPRKLVPAFQMHGCSMKWLVQLSVGVPRGPEPSMRVPVTVRPADAKPSEADEAKERALPLAVGSERLRLVWESVARSTGFEHIDGELHGKVGETSVVLRRDYSQGQAEVHGHLRFPDLGVGLRTHTVRKHILSDEFRHHLGARDPAQLAAVVERLQPILAQASRTRHQYDLTAAGDGGLDFRLRGPGSAASELRDFAYFLSALADETNELAGKLPAAALLEGYVDAWTEAAAALRAKLRVSDLRLTIEREASKLVVGMDFEDKGVPEGEVAPLRSTFFALEPGIAIPSRHHLLWTGDTRQPEHEWPLEALVVAPSWTHSERVSLHVNDRLVRLYMAPGLPDPRLEIERIEALFSLGKTIRGEQGPYR